MKVLAGTTIKLRSGLLFVHLQFQPRDLWIGVFFDFWKPLNCYIILIPCFPLHIEYFPNMEPMENIDE